MTWLALHVIIEYEDVNIFPGLVWVIWLGAFFFVYRKIKPDLFMLAGGCLSGIVVLVTFMARLMLEDFEAGGFLFLSLLVIGLGTGSAVWLRNVHRGWQS